MMDYRDLTFDELQDYLVNIGEKKFRAKQIFKWIHRGVEEFHEMTDLSISLREKLEMNGYLGNMEVETKQESANDETVKYLMHLKDGNMIECVLMRYSYGNSICISTQAGCSMGCSFCASTIGGKNRDLTGGEMIGQIMKVQRDAGVEISNIVLMGSGEPLDNLKNVLKFFKIVNHPEGINIGMRHITLSTCGLVPEIINLADMNLQITLAISLHGPNDEIRKRLMPIANKYSYDELLNACNYYIEKTNKRITFEYALIDGINDRKEDAKELSTKLKGMLCHVNLIPINKVKDRGYEKSQRARIEEFKQVLLLHGIETTVRRELGSDIDAACGQLRRSYRTES